MAFEALERSLLQAGQMRFCISESEVEFDFEFEEVEVEKLIEMRDFKLRGCGFVEEEAGQRGEGFAAEEGEVLEVFVEGVREGTQKEGRVCFADFSSSIAFLAFALSSLTFFSISSSFSSNFRFTPRAVSLVSLPAPLAPFPARCPAPSNPIIVLSNSLTLLSFSSSIFSL